MDDIDALWKSFLVTQLQNHSEYVMVGIRATDKLKQNKTLCHIINKWNKIVKN